MDKKTIKQITGKSDVLFIYGNTRFLASNISIIKDNDFGQSVVSLKYPTGCLVVLEVEEPARQRFLSWYGTYQMGELWNDRTIPNIGQQVSDSRTKRYLLFTGEEHYPSGGWKDLCGGFDTIEDAKFLIGSRDWAHIVDSDTQQIVYEFPDAR